MLKIAFVATIAALTALPAVADSDGAGDPAKGEKGFRKCQACHVVQDADGNTLAGRAGKVGPNLFPVPGGLAGSVDGFRYSDALVQANAAGLIWTEDTFVSYVMDPKGFLQEWLDDSSARPKMTFKLRKEDDARDMWAYLVSLNPDAMAGDGGDTDTGSDSN